MKHWEKSKKDHRRDDNERQFGQESHKKKKLRPIEKSKYRLKGLDDDGQDE